MNKYGKIILLLISVLLLFNTGCENEKKYNVTDEIIKNNKVKIFIPDKNNLYSNHIYLGLYYLNINNTVVNVFDIPKNINIPNNMKRYIILGYVVQLSKYEYNLYINNNNTYNNVSIVLTHEIIHIDQYHTNRLHVFQNGEIVRFEDKFYTIKDYPYSKRPWEIEAFDRQSDLNHMIRNTYR
jgi:hypothetical protein